MLSKIYGVACGSHLKFAAKFNILVFSNIQQLMVRTREQLLHEGCNTLYEAFPTSQ